MVSDVASNADVAGAFAVADPRADQGGSRQIRDRGILRPSESENELCYDPCQAVRVGLEL